MARRRNNVEFVRRESLRDSPVLGIVGCRWVPPGKREFAVLFKNKKYSVTRWELIKIKHGWNYVNEHFYDRYFVGSDGIRKREHKVEVTWEPLWLGEELLGNSENLIRRYLALHPDPAAQVVPVVLQDAVVQVDQNAGAQDEANAVAQQADEPMQVVHDVAEPNMMAPLAEMEIAPEAGEPNGGAMPPVPEPVVADVDMMEGAMLLLEFAGQFAI